MLITFYIEAERSRSKRCGVVFGVWSSSAVFTTVQRRIFPIEVLKSGTLILLCIATARGSTAILVPIYFIPLYFLPIRSRQLCYLCRCASLAIRPGSDRLLYRKWGPHELDRPLLAVVPW